MVLSGFLKDSAFCIQNFFSNRFQPFIITFTGITLQQVRVGNGMVCQRGAMLRHFPELIPGCIEAIIRADQPASDEDGVRPVIGFEQGVGFLKYRGIAIVKGNDDCFVREGITFLQCSNHLL